MEKTKTITNREYAKEPFFVTLATAYKEKTDHDVPVSKRQASKYRNGKGVLFSHRNQTRNNSSR